LQLPNKMHTTSKNAILILCLFFKAVPSY
jgi:hypothetical protein